MIVTDRIHGPGRCTPSGKTQPVQKRRPFALPGGFHGSAGQTKDTAGEHLAKQIDSAHQVDWQANLNLNFTVF